MTADTVVERVYFWTNDMRAELIARPTEYRGIQYRSKCEAMFAMYLDLNRGDGVIIQYEPKWATDGDYVVDFAVHRPVYEKVLPGGFPIVSTHVELIEYKPSTPTVSYCDEKAKSLMRIAKRIPNRREVSVVTMSIYYGSVYTTDRGAFLCNGTGFHLCKLNWLGKNEKRIRDYRFDLESDA